MLNRMLQQSNCQTNSNNHGAACTKRQHIAYNFITVLIHYQLRPIKIFVSQHPDLPSHTVLLPSDDPPIFHVWRNGNRSTR